jgi:hypothetical protein
MAVRTIYTCDLCGAEQDNDNQMWWVGIRVTAYRTYGNTPETPQTKSSTSIADHNKLCCRECCEKLGIEFRLTPKKDEPAPTYPTFEDLVNGIIDDRLSEIRNA